MLNLHQYRQTKSVTLYHLFAHIWQSLCIVLPSFPQLFSSLLPLTKPTGDDGLEHHLLWTQDRRQWLRSSFTTKGFDVTGVTTEGVDLTYPAVKNGCDCIQECLNRPTLCANYVFKFSTAAFSYIKQRTCHAL